MARDDSREAYVGSVLRDVLKRIDPDKRLQAFEVWNFWNDVVGNALSRRAQPSAYRNGVLIVTVGAHAWMQELQFMKDALRQRLNERLGSELIRDIYFVSGAVEMPAEEEKRPRVTEPVSELQSPVTMPKIEDPELAEAFRRLFEAHVRRRKRLKKMRD